MISDRRRQILRFLFVLVLSQGLAGLQTSLWSHLFGGITPPAFWIMLIIYLALYRDVLEGLVSLFFVCFSLSVYTSLPEGLLTLNALTLFSAARFLKSRIFVPTTAYFASTAAIGVVTFVVVHVFFSYIFEPTPITQFEVFPALVQVLMTFIFSVPIFSVLQGMDHFLRDDVKDGWGQKSGRLGR